MAYQSSVAAVLNQYLKTATGGNVYADRAVAVDRWFLFCDKCKTRLTFAEDYDIGAEYEKKGRLDSQIQAFAKEHLHLKPNFNPALGTVTYMPDQGPFTSPGVEQFAVKEGDCPHKKVVKHQMVNGDIWTRCLICAKTWQYDIELVPQSPPIPHKPLPQTATALLLEQQQLQQKLKNEAIIHAKVEALKAEAKKKYELELIMAENKIKLELMKAMMDKAGWKSPEPEPPKPPKKTEGRKFR